MADDQRKTGLVGEPLEFALPQPAAGAVAAAAVGGDDQAVGGAVARFADIVPPTADRVDGEGGRVVIDPDAHPSAIGADVVDPVRDCLAQFRDQEIVVRTASGWPRGRQVRPAFLKSPTNSFFLASTEIAG